MSQSITLGRQAPVFEDGADRTLDRVRGIYHKRGGQYADTWDLENLSVVLTRATLRRFGVELDPEQLRLLQLAALADVKDSRLIGEWNQDSVDDGIAYRALYCALRNEYEEAEAAPRAL
jgi:hypothetical protein